MVSVRVAPSAEVPEEVMVSAKALMTLAFGDRFTDHDWEHALGGVQAWIQERDEVLAHAALVRRALWIGERRFDAGYVEAVAVRPEHQGHGLGAAVMASLEGRASAYDLVALSASDGAGGFYGARGWVPWRGPTGVRSTARRVPTPDDDGAVWVLGGRLALIGLDLDADLDCDWRVGDAW